MDRHPLTRPWPLAALGGALLLSLPALAQTPATAPALTFEAMVEMTRARNVTLKLAAADVELANATVMAAGEPFDSALSVTAEARRAYQLGRPGLPESTITYRQVGATAGWSRRFRNGLTVTPEATASASRYDSQPVEDLTTTSARLRVSAPLLRDRGGAITAAPERAAGVDRQASEMDARSTLAETLVQAADVYWTYLAAERKIGVLLASEERSRRTVTVTQALVKGDERTGADLIQAQGYLSFRRAGRIAAEQQKIDVGRQMVLVAGAPGEGLAQLPRVVTDFPAPRPLPTQDPTPRWIAEALRRRPDLAAADLRLASAEARLAAARNELRSRLDVEVAAGYSGQAAGLGRFGELRPRPPSLEAFFTLNYQLPLEQTGVRGRVAQNAAAVQQRRLARTDLARRIHLGVLAALEAVKSSQLGLRESSEAVRLLEQTVDNEKRKFQLGSATLFSVNQAEDSLTSALIDKIDRQRDFAVALANLRLETGSLGAAAETSAALAAQLTSLPDERP
jgi:outer membrane protein